MKKLLFLALFVTIGYSAFSQQPGVVVSDKAGWHKIGETVVSFKTETDEIIVLGADRFASVKLVVKDAPVYLKSFDIYFEDETMQSVEVGMEIKVPGETRVVDLTGGERRLKKVKFTYKTVSNKMDERADVELWGKKTNAVK